MKDNFDESMHDPNISRNPDVSLSFAEQKEVVPKYRGSINRIYPSQTMKAPKIGNSNIEVSNLENVLNEDQDPNAQNSTNPYHNNMNNNNLNDYDEANATKHLKSTLKLHEFFFGMCCRSSRFGKKMKAINYGQKQLGKTLDLRNVIRSLRDVEKLKSLLLTLDQ